jgi:hypothetical protein
MAQSSLVPELELAIRSHDAQRRTAVLAKVADLFKVEKIRMKTTNGSSCSTMYSRNSSRT